MNHVSLGIEQELRDKLTRYGGKTVHWERLGVVAGDFAAFDLFPLPVKDSARSAAFVAQHGTRCAEVDALPPAELRRRVRDAIESHIEPGPWERLKRVEKLEQGVLLDFVGQWREETDLGAVSAEGGDE